MVTCAQCGYAANRQIANFAKSIPPAEELKPVEKVVTPDCKSIEALANLLNIPKSRTAKAVFMIAGHEEEGGTREEFIFAVVRGDSEVNEYKLANVLKPLLGGPVIAYWNNPMGSVCHNDVVALYEILGKLGQHETLYLFIKSSGGTGQASLRIVNLMREYNHCVHALRI